MARIGRKVAPVYTRGVNPLNFAGNGRLARAKAGLEVAQYANMLRGRRKKILGVAHKATPTGATSSREYFRWRVHTSPSTTALWIVILAIPSDSTLTTLDSFFQVTIATTSGATQSYQPIYVNKRNTGTPVPNEYFPLSQRLSPATNLTRGYQITPNTTYDVVLHAKDYARAHTAILYEEVDEFLPQRDAVADYHKGAGPSTSVSGSRALLQDTSASFNSSHLGSYITIAGFTGVDSGNNGTFLIDGITGEHVVTFVNASATVAPFTADTSYSITGLDAHVPEVMHEILADEHDEIADSLYQTHLRQGGHFFSWSDPAGIASVVSIVGANLHDSSFSVGYNATAPGHWVWPYKRGTYESALVPCTAWVYAKKTAGVGVDTAVRFSDSSGTLATLNVTSSTAAVYTGTVLLDSTATASKIDVGGIGNGTTTVTVYAYGLFQYGS